MTGVEAAVLTYHGREIAPERLVDDVRALRERGWRDVSLKELLALPSRRAASGRFFHVTLDDGSEEDRACVEALRGVRAAATLFVSLETMSERAIADCRTLLGDDVAVEDHSLRHARVFETRHVIGFWSSARPILRSPERLGLREGDPVCGYAGELTQPAFCPDPQANNLCRRTAADLAEAPGSAAWQQALAERLVAAGFGFYRVGRLCVAGTRETPTDFVKRLQLYLTEGRERLATLIGHAPIAFAHPWWAPSSTADRCLRELGYQATFSGFGVWSATSPTAIPRLFVSNATPRPIEPRRLARGARAGHPVLPRVKAVVARALFR